ncbi:MAG: hypothetical protein NC388_01335 [Clostridium sp.]|nr:hypothetical protein [Clostridium sp.]
MKKNINARCSEMFADCVAIQLFNKEVKHEDIDPIMVRVLNLQTDMLSRVNHVEPGNTRQFFSKLENDFSQESDEIYKALSALL